MGVKKFIAAVVAIIFALLMSANVMALDYSVNNSFNCTLNNQVIISNPNNKKIDNIVVDAPLMSDDQPPYQEKLLEQLDSKLINTYVDSNNQRRGKYNLGSLAPGEKKVVQSKYSIRNYAIKYNGIENVGTPTNNEDLFEYLLPEKYIESDDASIIKFADKLVADAKTDYDKVKNIYAGVNMLMTYTNVGDVPQGAKKAMMTGRGVCEDYTNLMIACLRAEGIPAKRVSGYRYDYSKLNEETLKDGVANLDKMRHVWVSFYLKGYGFVVADPTFTYTVITDGVPKKTVNWSFLGQIIPQSRLIFYNEGSIVGDGVKVSYQGAKPGISFNDYLEYGTTANPYKDIDTHWGKNNIIDLQLAKPGILSGYPDKTFRPNNFMTNAELATVVARLLGLSYGNGVYDDVTANHWAYGSIGALQGKGIMTGLDGKFYPNCNVTRGEVAVVLVKAFNLVDSKEAAVQFKDYGKMPSADKSISILKELGLAGGYPDNTFKPQNSISRAEVVTFIIRIIDNLEN